LYFYNRCHWYKRGHICMIYTCKHIGLQFPNMRNSIKFITTIKNLI
jgi:hypothetical protein